MNISFFLAKKIATARQGSFSRFIIRVAIVAVALSTAVMIIASGMIHGFRDEIQNKVFGFWGDIHIAQYIDNDSYENPPVDLHQPFYPDYKKISGIAHIEQFATKPGIMRSGDQMDGVVLKGIGPDFDSSFLKQYLVEGKLIRPSDTSAEKNICISQMTASRLKLKTGDRPYLYFFGEEQKIRRVNVCGIYKTGLEDYDKTFVLCDIRFIRQLNKWNDEQTGGFEVLLKNRDSMDLVASQINRMSTDTAMLAQTIRQVYPNIFDWLDLQQGNETVILSLMIIVAVINMITALLILILERTRMIGTISALGLRGRKIRSVFLYHAAYIAGFGILIGDLIGIGLGLAQHYFHLLKLPEESYYLSYAPFNFEPLTILLLNLATLLVCVVGLIGPSWLASRIRIVKALRFS